VITRALHENCVRGAAVAERFGVLQEEGAGSSVPIRSRSWGRKLAIRVAPTRPGEPCGALGGAVHPAENEPRPPHAFGG